MAKLPAWAVMTGSHREGNQLFVDFAIRRWHPSWVVFVFRVLWQRRGAVAASCGISVWNPLLLYALLKMAAKAVLR